MPYEVGQRLWQSRYGDRTSVRLRPAPGQPLGLARRRRDPLRAALRSLLDPARMGLTVRAVRTEGLAASSGSTDFGEYFVYFSFFLVASALVLAVLFFRLGVEQRAREVGLLRAVGFSTPRVRRLFAAEGLLLAVIGSADRHRRRRRLRRADDGRPAHLVVGRGGDDRADAARVADLARSPAPSARSSPRWAASGGRCAASRGSRSAVC